MTARGGVIAGVSVSHVRASVDQLEAADPGSQRRAAERLLEHPGIEEAFVLKTCNRVEAYVVADDYATGREALGAVTADVDETAVVEMDHEQSLRHLLRVAAGLESVVLGEDQILGQVRNAYNDARSVGGVGPLLSDGVTKALHVGERARSETDINDGVLSLGSAAVRLATAEFGDPSAGLVVGAGKMGRLAAKSLAEAVDRLTVANRTVQHAERVVDMIDSAEAHAVGLDGLDHALDRADVVVTATAGPGHVVDTGTLAAAGETVVADIAQPRDVPEAADALPGVTVHDLDALESVTAETRRQREAAAEEVEAMVDAEFDRLLSQYKRKRADQVISAMYESAERVKTTQVGTALGKLDLDEEEEAVVESMADAIVSQLLAAPTSSLRDAAEEDDWSTIHTALQLFDPNFGPEETPPPEFVTGATPGDIPEEMREDIPAAVLEQIDD